MNGSFDTAQICQNGHLITASLCSDPQDSKQYCPKCGEKTINQCPNCSYKLQGSSINPEYGIIRERYKLPLFCFQCGKPFPWIVRKIEHACELVNVNDNLIEDEKVIFKKSIEEIAKDSPGAAIASMKIKKYLFKMGEDSAKIFKDILVDIVSETVKRSIWP